jgi:hypothetical protein
VKSKVAGIAWEVNAKSFSTLEFLGVALVG